MIGNKSRHFAFAATLLLIDGVVTAQVVAAATPQVRTIARSNQTAAGAGSARFLNFFSGFSAVNDQGQVAFGAYLTGSGVSSTNEQGLWFSASLGGPLSLVSRFGSLPPGLPAGSRYGWYYESLDVNNLGNVSFVSGIDPALQPVETGAWSSGGGMLHLLAADRYPIPGAPGAPVPTEGVYFPLLNDSGQTSFFSNYDNATLWVDTPGQPLRRVASAGDLLPGGANLKVKHLGPGLIDANGRVAFGARVTTPADPIGVLGLWSETGGTLQVVAREGGTSLGIPGSVQSIYGASMNSIGQLAIDVVVTSPPDSRLIAAQRLDGLLRVIAQTNTPLPGSAETLANLYTPSINAHGHVAFAGFLSDYAFVGAPTSVWAEDSTGLGMIARVGDAAPGADGTEFAFFDHLQFNDFGEVMFEAFLTQGVGGVTSSNDEGLWLRTRSGRLTLIAREGDLIDIDPGPGQNLQQIFALNTISALPNLLTTDRRTLTNRGEVLFDALFHNGSSGLFLSLPVPEPSGLVIATLVVVPFLVNFRAQCQRQL